jgi:hypothetical protein
VLPGNQHAAMSPSVHYMNKDLVFIVSAGRTGTQFFGRQLGSIISDCVSAHEPDRYAGFSRETGESIRRFGFNQVVLQRVLRRSGIRHLTQQYLAGHVSEHQATRKIHAQRDAYLRRQSASLVIESYYQWYGLLPCLRRAYPNCRIVGIVRDPRTWVMSMQHRKLRHALGRFAGRLTPRLVGDTEQQARWQRMDEFERLCWEWKTINELIIAWVNDDPLARLYRFEDLFPCTDRQGNCGGDADGSMRSLLTFITRFDDRSYNFRLDERVMASRLNASGEVPARWPDWPRGQSLALHRICGELMRGLGYGDENAWTELTHLSE